MIKCEILRNGKEDAISFDIDIEGISDDVILEVMRIMGEMVKVFRRLGIEDENIEKQFVHMIKGAFDLADGKLTKRRKNE